MLLLLVVRSAAWNSAHFWVPVIAQANPQTADPFSSSLLNYGLLGLFVVAILYFKVIVPGWVYQAEVERGKQKDEIIKAKDEEITRLRDLAESQTIPFVQRALGLIERAEAREEAWKVQQSQQHPSYGGYGTSRPPPGMEG